MAQNSPSSAPLSASGANRIRSLRDQDSIFKAFDSYPWTKDTAFLSGLHAILGDPNSSSPQPGSPRDIATHARIFYYSQRIGVSIDFSSYQQWLAQHPEHQPPDILPEGYGSTSHSNSNSTPSSSTIAWQEAAPKADLYVDRASQAQSSASDGDQPSYPMAFADMISLIQQGLPVPGIRQIPNTIERDSKVTPMGSRPAPRKPWERGVPEATALTNANSLDLEFPPLEDEETPGAAGPSSQSR